MSAVPPSDPRPPSGLGPRRCELVLLCLLAAPRLLRMLFPAVWVEDDFYLASAWLVEQGERPYLDFVHPHLPLLEWAVAVWLRVAGASHRSLECLSALVVFATSLLVLRIGERAFGRRAGCLGACLFAWSSLGFRYHVFERESFAALALCAALWLALRETPSRRSGATALGLCLLGAAAVKLTALIPACAVLGHVAWVRRDGRCALRAAGIAALGLTLIAVACGAHYGSEFWLQVGLFHLGKGQHAAVAAPLFPGRVLDALAPLFALGVLRVARRRPGPGAFAVLGWAGLGYAFYGFASPTVWAHNYLELLPALAAVAGYGAEGIWRGLAALRRPPLPRGAALASPLGALLFTGLCLAGPTPLRNENWERDSVYGFGYLPRAELALLANALREASAPDASVVAPAFLCFEAGRRPLIRFPETTGVYRDVAERADRDGWLRTWRDTTGAGFFERIGATAHHWQQPLDAALRSGAIDVIVPDSEWMLQAIVGPPPERLRRLGFRPALRSPHFVLWQRRPTP